MTLRRRSVVIHAHFYQPPREDPWTGEVPREPSAAPYHDWDRRIHDECYRAVAAARALDGDGRIAGMINALEWISWDAGPTLLRWLAREAPRTYTTFLEGDRNSIARLGHGNALAAPYHHIILPLASRRDKTTEVRWGIADFRRRFGREPEGMWLPEAAVDMETLEVLAGEGIGFTILGPSQVKRAPTGGLPGLVRLSGGRSIAVCIYDGPLSGDVAFGDLLEDAGRWADRMAPGDPPVPGLTSLATDGETFGHHRPWGDLALAGVIHELVGRRGVRVENYASFLAAHPPVEEVTVVEPSSWSCVHGVERWRANCGCRIDPTRGWQQEWRRPLREGLDELADTLHDLFERNARAWFDDPWAVRDAFGRVVGRGEAELRRFVEGLAARPLARAETERAIELLEMEWDALRMFTSCGWFFDDIGRIESVQILRFAAHALDLAGPEVAAAEEALRRSLARARSNRPAVGTGARIWDRSVRGRLPVEAWAGVEAPEAGGTPPEGRQPELPPGSSEAPSPEERRLVDAVRDLAAGIDPWRAADAAASARALTEAGRPIPYDAQTGLWHVLAERTPAEREPLADVAEALGFGPEAMTGAAVRASAPMDFIFGLHVHQPVGNFERVFRKHADEVYAPFLQRLAGAQLLPLTLHVSGPLLEWLEARGHAYLDLIGRLVSEQRAELLLSGFYEPILTALTHEERIEQIGWMRSWIRDRWGVEASGLWLTERVWEPDLASDLCEAGISYVIVDDHHFMVAGMEPPRLRRPFRTEFAGKPLDVLPIDERLRYLVPFRPPAELERYLRTLHAAGHEIAVLVDDGEKFGGWPGTAEWVWKSGWLDAFLGTLHELIDEGVIRLSTPARTLGARDPGGLTYLPSASYREMEGWSLPPDGALRLRDLEAKLGDELLNPRSRALVRGGHWRNFLARYPESNRMHKKARALSELCRARGNPPAARRAIGRAQCNDAYWHGVFGGLYLRHLRDAVWANLAEAEAALRYGEPLAVEVGDADGDGHPEVRIHGAAFSALVSPARGGAVEELTIFASRRNLANVLTRRREAYHHPTPPAETVGSEPGGMPSIHEMERGIRFDAPPPFDFEERALLVDRVLPPDAERGTYEQGRARALASWARASLDMRIEAAEGQVELVLARAAHPALEKRLRFTDDGVLHASYRWDPAAFPADAWFAPEISLGAPAELEYEPAPGREWRYEIVTVSKSEHGTEESVQGVSITPLWPAALGEARLTVRPVGGGRGADPARAGEPSGGEARAHDGIRSDSS